MKFAEIVYETGAHSVVSYDSLDELQEGLLEQHSRAINGLNGGPAGHTAERIKRVINYDYHPADYTSDTVPAGVLSSLLSNMANSDGMVNPHQLIEAIRDETSPVYPVSQGRHESLYKMEGADLDLAFLDNNTAGTDAGNGPEGEDN